MRCSHDSERRGRPAARPPRRRPPRLTVRTVLAALVLTALSVSGFSAPLARAADVPFDLRWSQNLHGGVSRASNTTTTCSKGRYSDSCPDVQAGTPSENYRFWMTFIDADGDPSTFDSSRADLKIPAGATVTYARLYWGGLLRASQDNPDLPPGNRLAPDAAAKNKVKLKVPGRAAYRTVTAAPRDVDETTTSSLPVYQASADVTALVAAGGAGPYWVADVQGARGDGGTNCNGWTLVVAYEDDASPLRNVAVFDGLVNEGASDPPVTIRLSGYQTPPRGRVHAQVGIVAYEGDVTADGDGASVTSGAGPAVRIGNATNPPDDLFNSSITTLGAQDLARRPAYINTLGYDSDVFDISSAVHNGDTSMGIELNTHGDAYLPGVVFTQIDLYAAHLDVDKTVKGPSPARPGDILEYTVRVTDTGPVGAASVILEDVVPPHSAYVPGSLRVDGKPPAAGTATVTGGRITARLGTGATATAGGALAPGQSARVTFKVTVANSAAGRTVDNAATVGYASRNLPSHALTDTSNTVRTPVVVRDPTKPPGTGTPKPPTSPPPTHTPTHTPTPTPSHTGAASPPVPPPHHPGGPGPGHLADSGAPWAAPLTVAAVLLAGAGALALTRRRQPGDSSRSPGR
ncbi:DUF11 domain-containing protein [Streptomyces sp. NPDC048659]|uniref:DUF11 domain-containing protein n=1 Tax=Streptomyces sp. NPDC048659 TaxID=3155489 RepID=UPI0034449ACE